MRLLMSCSLFVRRIVPALSAAGLLWTAGCGSDGGAQGDVSGDGGDVLDAAETDGEDAATDMTAGDDGAGDTGTLDTGSGDTDAIGDTAVPDTGTGDTGAGDVGETSDTLDDGDTGMGDTAVADTGADAGPDDTVSPPAAGFGLVAWSGFNPGGPQRGGVSVAVASGAAFGPFEVWRTGTDAAPMLFGSTANLMGDIDGDGLADLVAWSGLNPNGPQRGGINVLLSGGADFGDAMTWRAGTDAAPVVFGSTANLIGDVDGDGKADLIAWSGFNPNGPQRGGVSVYLSTGTGFADVAGWKSGTDAAPVVFGSTANQAGDVDGDGKVDLIAWTGFNPNGPQRGAVVVHRSTGAAFGDAVTWKAGTDAAPVVFGATANLVGDIDGDGRADLVAMTGMSMNGPARGSISVMRSTGTGFGDAATWYTGTNDRPVVAGTTANLLADVNGDGRADLVAWSGLELNGPGRGGVSVYLSTGSGFEAAATWLAGTNERPVLFGTTANLGGPVAD